MHVGFLQSRTHPDTCSLQMLADELHLGENVKISQLKSTLLKSESESVSVPK